MGRDPLSAGQRLLKRIERCNKLSIIHSGNIDPSAIAVLIDEALSDDINRMGVLLALSEFVGFAIEGCVIDPNAWQPLIGFKRPSRK